MFLLISKKVDSAFRHSIWKKMEINGLRKIFNKQDSIEMVENIKANESEEFRRKALEFYKVEISKNEKPTRVLQKAYLNFSTDLSISESDRCSSLMDPLQSSKKNNLEMILKLLKG